MNKYKFLVLLIIPLIIAGFILSQQQKQIKSKIDSNQTTDQKNIILPSDPTAPLTIQSLINRKYPASKIIVEETLESGINYNRYIASYQSDGLKIYGLFTVPNTDKPKNGYPSIVFLHGYLDPKTYQTTERYVAYQDGFARNGFITFKPDLRGHGNSEGKPVNSNFSQEYVIDSLNLVSALKIYKDANPKLIGMWGHSNGGGITMRALEVSKDIKAAVIWSGVVGSYEDLLVNYRSKIPWINNRRGPTGTTGIATGSFQDLIRKYGKPDLKSPFWSQVDPYTFIKNISAPVELHHGTVDESVPIEVSIHFDDVLKKVGKTVELYQYQGGDHNLADPAFSIAMGRSINFFKKYLQ